MPGCTDAGVYRPAGGAVCTGTNLLIADVSIGGQPVAVSSGGGGNSDSDLRWDGRKSRMRRKKRIEEGVCYMPQVVRNSHKSTIHR
ncbi:MAG: hypothetical protein V8R52_01370 [Coprobacter fastidiosus]